MTPRMPYKHVEAPAFIELGAHRAENMFPAIAVMMQIIMHLMVPKLYSNRDSKIIVLVKLPKKCIKFTCNTAAVISLQTYPLLIRQGTFAPIFIKVSALIYRSYPSFCNPMTAYAMNTPRQITSMTVVKERHLKVGQHIQMSISKQCSSLGFLTFLLPDKNSTLCLQTTLKCSMVIPQKSPWFPKNAPAPQFAFGRDL